jgi:ferredoxin like protein
MTESDEPRPAAHALTVEDKLGLVDFKRSPQPHIQLVDSSPNAPCVDLCKDRPCTTVCPAKVYEWDKAQQTILVAYENCIECGACRMICPFDNIRCEWPGNGYGVKYKYG